jgi:hypothetical protein
LQLYNKGLKGGGHILLKDAGSNDNPHDKPHFGNGRRGTPSYHGQSTAVSVAALVAHGQARLFGVADLNPPGSVRSTLLSDSSVSVSLIHACGGITPCV